MMVMLLTKSFFVDQVTRDILDKQVGKTNISNTEPGHEEASGFVIV